MLDSQTRRHLQSIHKAITLLDQRIKAIESGSVTKVPKKTEKKTEIIKEK